MFVAMVALAGCDQAPVEPESDSTVLFKRGGGGGGGGGGEGGASTYDIEFSNGSSWDIQAAVYDSLGQIDTSAPLGQSGVGGNNGQIEIGGAGRDHRFRMSADFLNSDDALSGWQTCFGVNEDGSATDMRGFSGDMVPDKKGGVTTTFYFNREARDGQTAVSYRLTLSGTVDGDGTFPPAASEEVRVKFTFMGAELTGGKGKNAGRACSGEPLPGAGSGVTVTHTS